MVGRTPWKTAPRMLQTSPASQTMMKKTERPSAEERRKFSRIWGEKTTIQQAIEMDLEMVGLMLVTNVENLGAKDVFR